MLELLFVYGTLHPDRAPSEIADAALAFKPSGPGRIRGTLYQLDGYPGVMVSGETRSEVDGFLFEVPSELFGRLDAYEGFDPRRPETSLFLRQCVAVTRPDGSSVMAWVYLYNGEPPH